MGKKGSWFSAIKKVFTHNSKEKVANGTEKISSKEKEKKKGPAKQRHKHGDGRSFIPMFRKPSSIEKILGEAEREHHAANYRPLNQPELPKAPPHAEPPSPPEVTIALGPRLDSPPREAPHSTSPPPLQKLPSPPPPPPPQCGGGGGDGGDVATQDRAPSQRFVQQHRPEPPLREHHICATKIQAAYRSYMARRSYRALRGLVRMQAVLKGKNVKRQTANALKCMQVLVNLQNQIHSRRIQMIDNLAQQRQNRDKDHESIFSKWNLDDWDDTTLTKEEKEARIQKKVDAVVRRERAMAYAYSHQSGKSSAKTTPSVLMNLHSGGFPYWWNWMEERQITSTTNPSQRPAINTRRNAPLTPPSTNMKKLKQSNSPSNSNFRQHGFGFDNPGTPTSTKSSMPPSSSSRSKFTQTPPPPGRGTHRPKMMSSTFSNYSPFSGGGGFRDDDSLTSCPPFSVPRYMSPTMSAKAKFSSPSSETNSRRVSFPLDQEFKWKRRGALFPPQDKFGTESSIGSQNMLAKTDSFRSVGKLSAADSTVSMPAIPNVGKGGRKPFNRFV